jgi:hypothetical protein
MSHIHRPFEDFIVYLLYDFRFIGADCISLLTYALAFGVVYLIVVEKLALGLSLALLVGVLDGVDGKLARAMGVHQGWAVWNIPSTPSRFMLEVLGASFYSIVAILALRELKIRTQ